MRRQRKSALVVLVLCLCAGASMTVTSFSLRQYTRGLYALTGHVGLKFEERRRQTSGSTETKVQLLRKEVAVQNKGFVWDPRFMLFDLGMTIADEDTKTTPGGRSTNDYLAFNLTSTLFPRWRYPYRPITLNALRSTNTIKPFGQQSYDLDTTILGARWGLVRQPYGQISLDYDVRFSESSNDSSPRDETTHRFETQARKTIRKEQWGESDIKYGYRLDASKDKAIDSDYVQHYLHSDTRSKFGPNKDLTAAASYYRRTQQTGAGNESNEMDFLTADARLNVQANEWLRHNYSLALARTTNNGEVDNRYSGAASVLYNRPLNQDWSGTLSSTLSASADRPASGDASNRGNASGTGILRYSHTHGNYLVNGSYGLTLSKSMGDDAQQRVISQSALVGYTRLNNPLYADQLQLRAFFQNGETQSQSYNLYYRVTSELTAQDRLTGRAEYNRNQSDGSTSSVWTGRLDWLHQLSRSSNTNLLTEYRVSTTDDSETTARYIEAYYRTALFRRRNLQLMGRLRWQQTTSDVGDDTDESRAEVDLNYFLGKWRAALTYEYREIESGSQTDEDSRIMLEARRYYGLRY